MATFPTLKTGAVQQYPAVKSLAYTNQVIRFLDGAEQRYRGSASPLHRWVIQLDLLDESELSALQQFFIENEGAYGVFSFTDPWDGSVYPNCGLESDDFRGEFKDEMRAAAQLIVRESRHSQ